MRISDMPISDTLNGSEFAPIFDPQQLDISKQNRRVNIQLFQGIAGPRGFPGLTAYELWLNNGNTGTVDQFLNSLIGPAGTNGVNGTNGASAYQSWLNIGNIGTEQNFIASLQGLSNYQIWLQAGNVGSSTDFLNTLRGAQGLSAFEVWLQAGHSGTVNDFINFITGASAYQIWLAQGNTGTQAQFIESLRGTQGPQGVPGTPGQQGLQGPPGQSGSRWYQASGAPTNSIGSTNDYYLDTSNGNVYNRISTGWTGPITNLRGPAGTNGTNGTQGPQGIQGPPGPQGLPGLNGNGSPGSVLYNGAGVPANGLGIVGDYYLNTTNGDVYTKTSSGWNTPIANFTGPIGVSTRWYTGNGVPITTVGINNDLYLNGLNGDVYIKVNGTWTLSVNIRGPQGTTGPQGAQGIQGLTGASGATGPGVANGGTINQVLIKNSSNPYDTSWVTADSSYMSNISWPAPGSQNANYTNGNSANNGRLAVDSSGNPVIGSYVTRSGRIYNWCIMVLQDPSGSTINTTPPCTFTYLTPFRSRITGITGTNMSSLKPAASISTMDVNAVLTPANLTSLTSCTLSIHNTFTTNSQTWFYVEVTGY